MTFFGISLQNLVSISFIVFILTFILFVRPSNKWHYVATNEITLLHKIVIVFTLLMSILVTVLPMSLSPYWNGSIPYKADKQQYDRMADALLQGHLYIDNGDIDPALSMMENPYDSVLRETWEVEYHWDEAYYNNHYYMYFGIVPTLILFLPFKLLTGKALLSYQATQVFAALSIVGMFYLFYMLCRHFFAKMPFSLYLVLSSAFSILSIGYSIEAPALYCTAIVSAVCLMIWSLVCFIKGAWSSLDTKWGNCYLFAGGLLGALAFGCRPPVALANLVIIPVLAQIYDKKNVDYAGKMKSVISLLFPYLFIGLMLMAYNYARFDNAFEFGQSYQLTVTDQHSYRSFSEKLNLSEMFLELVLNFHGISHFVDQFPFLFYNGAFVNFPILLLSFKIFTKNIGDNLKKKQMYLLAQILLLIPFIISIIDIYWTPFLLERYRLDFYYLLCIVSFISIASWLEVISKPMKKILICSTITLGFAVFLIEFLFFCIPFDGSYTYYYPEILEEIYKGLRFGF